MSVCGNKWVLDSLELELEAIISHLTWRLGLELRTFAIAVVVLNHSAISSVTLKDLDTIQSRIA